MTNRNKAVYKGLKSKLKTRKKKSAYFKQGVANTLNSLLPQDAKKPGAGDTKKDSNNYNKLLQDLQKSYDTKLQGLQKDYTNRLLDKDVETEKTTKALQDRLAKSEKYAEDLSIGVQKELDKIYANKGKKEKTVEQSPEQSLGAGEQRLEDIAAYTKTFIPDIPASDAENKEVKDAKSAGIKSEDKKVQKTIRSVMIGDSIDVGDYIYKATGSFGPRQGVNYVPGRKEGEHSRGVDLVSYDKQGNKVNLPVSLVNGTIVGVSLQGSGKAIHPTQGAAGGYIVDIIPDNAPGKVVRYLHLDPSVMENKDNLIGKKIKKGDLLAERGRFSGSGTGPHIKVMVSDMDEKGNIMRNYTDPTNDPSQFLFNV